MHNFNNINKWNYIKAAVFILICCVMTVSLNFALQQYNIARVNVHRISTRTYDDIFVGTSHGLSAINPEVVDRKTGRKSTNVCMPDEHLIDSYYLVKEACRKHKPKRIIYELDFSYWSVVQNKGSNAVYIYEEFPLSLVKAEYFAAKIKEMDFRVTLAPWFYFRNKAAGVIDNVKLKCSDAYKNYEVTPLNTGVQMYTEEGFMYQVSDPNADKGDLNIVLWDKNNVQDTAKKYFAKLVNYCKKQNIELIVITTPVPQETLDAYQSIYNEAHAYYTKLLKEYEVPYYDFNTLDMDGFDKSIINYLDYEGHMTGETGNTFSEVLGEYLKK